MRRTISSALALVTVAGLTLPVLGQSATVTPDSPQQPGTAYTAEFKETTVRMLANGTTITLELTKVMATDSQGRSMLSTTYVSGYEGGKHSTKVYVTDPVTRTSTEWPSPGNQATVTKMPANHAGLSVASDCVMSYTTPAGSTPEASTGSGASEPPKGVVGKLGGILMKSSPDRIKEFPARQSKNKTVVEDLGTTTIQGIEAHGTRYTWTTPAGAEGNDAPLVHSQEFWTATGLGFERLTLRHIDNDPESGKSESELVKISLGEPDPALFQPPEGYEIVNYERHVAPCPNALKPPTQ